MVERDIITIDEDLCTGCGACIPGCPEGALQVIDGKARLVSDLMCDGLGACLGHCPEGAMTVEKREAEEYDEKKVMVNIVKAGENTIKAHLKHLKEHNQTEFYNQAIEYLTENNVNIPKLGEQEHKGCPGSREVDFSEDKKEKFDVPCGCPGSKTMDFSDQDQDSKIEETGDRVSHLQQWPVQLHLVSPMAGYYQGKDVLISADCVAYSLGDFHKNYLQGRSLTIACPKLDSNQEIYVEKIKALIDEAKVNTLTVMIMEVPCCRGLLMMVQQAAGQASRKVPIKKLVVGIKGKILIEEWV